MPARNTHHTAVIAALVADGWTITHDPLTIPIGQRHIHIDLGIEPGALAAERDNERIAVEIQTFGGQSLIQALHEAVGKFVVYRAILRRDVPERTLYLAVPRLADESIFAEPIGQLVIADIQLRYLVYDEQQRKVIRWIR